MTAPRALIAEDEPLLAQALERELKAAWPELDIVARAADGPGAIAAALSERPDILFLDIQMPGAGGLEVAAAVADEWAEADERTRLLGAQIEPGAPRPLVVFVTAFDHYALAAFESAAVDYVLKPLTAARLAQTVSRLREQLAQRAALQGSARGDNAAFVQQMQALALAPPAASPGAAADVIRVIRAAEATGTRVRMIPLLDVLAFEAADKYVNVMTEAGDALVRISLRELLLRLDPAVEFVQVHRGLLVNAQRIVGAERDEAGHYWLTLRGLPKPLKVSRAFSHLFKPM
jgi:DNA-binding LytR/AlgR family response regulator